jgi:hypothetical protein
VIDVIAVRDGLLYRALPLFNGCLAFLPACSSPGNSSSDTDATDESGSVTTNDPDTTLTTAPAESSESSTSDPGTDTALDTSSTGEPEGCPEGSLCADGPPDGWFGPTIIARVPHGESVPACPEEYPTAGQELYDGFSDPPAAECNCECSPPASPSCNANLYVHGPNSCAGFQNFLNIDATCQNLDIDGFAEFNLYGGYGYYYNPGMCTAETSSVIPPIAWDTTIATCRLSDSPLSCSGGKTCIPPAPADFEATWCIYQQGDAGCPAGVFNTKTLFFSGATDTRDCGDCSCGSPANSCEGGELLMFNAIDCAGDPDLVLEANGACQDVDVASFAINYPSVDTCPVGQQPQPMGAAEPTGEFKFCCAG